MLYLLIFLEAFLLGSIPFGLLISFIGYRIDLRKHGSGNIGTTNAMRTLGFTGGSLTLVGDTLKGYFAGVIALFLMAGNAGVEAGPFVWESIVHPFAGIENALPISVAVLGSCMGHVFSPWLKFKGGKGVAVAAGCLFVLFGWAPGFLELAIFGAVILISKYVSLGSLVAATFCPIIAAIMFWPEPLVAVICAVTCALIYWAHRENIARLRAGNENRIGKKKPQETEA